MSGRPTTWQLPAHVAGTTWAPVAVDETDETDGTPGVPVDLTGATARMSWLDDNGDLVAWDAWLAGQTDPVTVWTIGAGLEMPEPTEGRIIIVGPGVIDVPVGTLRGDLKVTLGAEVFVDVRIIQPIIGGYTT